MRRSYILSTGFYVPDRVVTNDDLSKMFATSDEWIRQRTGIERRRYAPDDVGCAELAYRASLRALQDARMDAKEIDCIVLATLSPDYHFPGSACLLGRKLGLPGVPAIDIRAQCSGFIYSLATADHFIRGGQYQRILVVGSEKHSMALEFSDRGRDVTVLFGDGAGVVILAPTEEDRGVLSTHLHADGEFAESLWLECPGSAHPRWATQEMLDQGRMYPRMKGKVVFKHAVEKLPQVMQEALAHNRFKIEDVDLFIFHQANLRIIEFVAQQMGIPRHKIYNNMQEYANTTAASIPIALHEALGKGLLKPGQHALLCSFGSGWTWASALLRW
ncbi:MAG: beta-ketoacyl-ACP synthase III [bacterium]